ncbi:MAG: hypothetical protein E2P00_05350 [Acidobacteria bacterium]|nr:MAG: hypothetical protein E2P00_05350 [Acidobacteriota bacterium]
MRRRFLFFMGPPLLLAAGFATGLVSIHAPFISWERMVARLTDNAGHSTSAAHAAPPGRWRPVQAPDTAARPADATLPGDDLEDSSTALDDADFRRRLATLGYLAGHDAAPSQSGVIHHDPAAASPGLNLTISGHAAEARLMDMDGRILHTWQREFHQVWPRRKKVVRAEGWRRVHLFPDGSLLAIYDGLGLVKLDSRSRVIWSYDGHVHHDLEIQPDGSIYTLTWKARRRPDLHPGEPILDDQITILDSDGTWRRDISLLDALEKSPYASLLAHRGADTDIFHTNTIEVLDGRFAHLDAAFKAGNIMVAIRYLDTIAIIDPGLGEMVWALSGVTRWPHQPTFLDNGHLLIFDNLGPETHSRVIEIDPITRAIIWNYAGSPARPFFSESCGTAQRLANGNTLITESDRGRAFELDPTGRVVWEFLNPARAGEQGRLIATLYEVVRLPVDFPTDWASSAPPSSSVP